MEPSQRPTMMEPSVPPNPPIAMEMLRSVVFSLPNQRFTIAPVVVDEQKAGNTPTNRAPI